MKKVVLPIALAFALLAGCDSPETDGNDSEREPGTYERSLDRARDAADDARERQERQRELLEEDQPPGGQAGA